MSANNRLYYWLATEMLPVCSATNLVAVLKWNPIHISIYLCMTGVIHW